ncbi:cAMP-dependent protein kinase type 2 [Phlyctema vagabunda]|uniref:cAMP-dependent protein kinase n=1 Tax=Phlyctema vagabunda TaxID=108571 RepID=A0ABR4PKM7_9HELO
MLLATANVTLSQINHDNLAGKLSEVHQRNQDKSVEHATLLVQVQTRLEETNKLLAVGNTITAKVRDSLKLDWFKSLGIELKNYMRKIIMINMAIYQAVLTIQGDISASTGRAPIQEPFILEDAIGRLSPVHLLFIDSWEAFDSVLNLRFRNLQGHKKVLKKEEKYSTNATCPSCYTVSEGSQEDDVLWLQSTLNSTQNHDLEERKAWSEFEALKASLGELHSDVLLRLNSLARLLRNHGKFSLAEELISTVTARHEEELLASCPGILQLLLSALMSALVDQQKHDAADELWQESVNAFRELTDQDSVDNLTRLFREVYPLQCRCQSVMLQAAVSLLTNLSDKAFTVAGVDMFSFAVSNTMQLDGPRGKSNDCTTPRVTKVAERDTLGNVASNRDSDQELLLGTEGHETFALEPRISQKTRTKYNLSDFEVHRTIGTGTFARVHLVKSKHNERFYAIKVFKKRDVVKLRQVEHTNDERRLLASVRSLFIPRMWGTFQDSNNLYMISNFVEGGELFSLPRMSGRFPNPVAKFYAAEIVLAIRLENILLSRHGHLKLCDFGFAKEVPDITYTLCGTPDYLAPEVISSKGYNKSVDWWSFGILIYEMLCGFTPFWDKVPMKIFENILEGQFTYPRHLHPDAMDLMNLITPDLSTRLGNLVNGPDDIKQHAWFAEVAWERLAAGEIDPPYTPPVQVGAGDASQYDRYLEDIDEPYGQTGQDEYFSSTS